MAIALTRIILYVQDVERLSVFYREAFGLQTVEYIAGEWAVLRAGACELALHRAARHIGSQMPAPGRSKVTQNLF
jgi:catechol-2,3-dioxygenase